MSERFFRYVPLHRVAAWVQAGWVVISGPLSMKPPIGLEGSHGDIIEVHIIEWKLNGEPIEPNE